MNHKRIIATLMLFGCLSVAPATLSANEFDYHILNAGINLGWAEATVQLLGVNAGTTPYLTGVLSNATAHLSAAQSLIDGTMWEFIQLPSVNPEIARFLTFTSGWTQGQQVNYIKSVISKLNAKLAQYNSEGSFQSGPTCQSNLLHVGYHFGRAHIGAYVGNQGYQNSAHGSYTNSINNGLRTAPSRKCDFATLAEWKALPFTPPITVEDYGVVLYPMQVLVWKLGDFLDPPPPPAPPSLPPLPSDFSVTSFAGRWNTTWRTMEISISGTRVTGRYDYQNGRIEGVVRGNVIEGRWYQDNRPQGGSFRFELSADGKSFSGNWNYAGDSGWKGAWNGTRIQN